MSTLRSSFESYVSLTDEVWAEMEPLWKPASFPKNAIITAEGAVESHFYWVIEGVQSLYYPTPGGNDMVLGFTYTGNFSGVYDSFVTRRPALCFLQAVTASKVLAISFADMQSLFDKYHSVERFGRLFIESILFGRGIREVELTTLSAEERFARFMKRSPQPLQQVPQKLLASYLNMTPETFSRLRKRNLY